MVRAGRFSGQSGAVPAALSWAGRADAGYRIYDAYSNPSVGTGYRAAVSVSREVFNVMAARATGIARFPASNMTAITWVNAGVSTAAGAIPIE